MIEPVKAIKAGGAFECDSVPAFQIDTCAGAEPAVGPGTGNPPPSIVKFKILKTRTHFPYE